MATPNEQKTELSEIAGYLTSVASELFTREQPNSETPL